MNNISFSIVETNSISVAQQPKWYRENKALDM